MTKVVNFKSVKRHWDANTQQWDSPEYVYIGRRNHAYHLPLSPFANFAPVKAFGRARAIELFRKSIARRIAEGKCDLETLRGKTLVCWCAPELCHGDILVELLEEREEST